MSSPSIKYDSEAVEVVITTWGQAHSIDVEATLLLHLEQKFPARSVCVLAAAAEGSVLMLTLHSEQWKDDKEFGLTAEGSLVWQASVAAKNVDKFSRTPKSLMDEMVLDAAKQGKGTKIIDNLGDPQFKGMEKWSYSEKSAAGLRSEVHCVHDPKTGELMDFKFKHQAETYR